MKLDAPQCIGRMLCVSLSAAHLTRSERQMLERLRPGGVILFARNCRSPQQVRALTDEIRQLLPRRTLIGLDQEGGRVDRLRSLMTPMPAAEDVARRGGASAAATLGELTARALRLLGFNFNFAPVLDLLTPARRQLRNGLEGRTFGDAPPKVTQCAIAYLGALQDGGISGCLKHFPGLGAASVDPHNELPVVAVSREELEQVDLVPFQAVLETGLARAVMVSHAAYPNLNGEMDNHQVAPASLSRSIVTDLLRDRLAFDGVAVTDDLTMGAAIRASGSLARTAARAVAAGADLLLLCAPLEQIEAAHAALTEELEQGAISAARIEQSLARLDRLGDELVEPESFDQRQLEEISRQVASLRADLSLINAQ
jgi:beta-N-acetylhexosaminidase